jgi:hypothetical protein
VACERCSALSSIVHLNRDSHLLSPQPVWQPREKRIVSPFTLGFSDHFAQRKIAILVDFGQTITRELTSMLAQGPDIQ